MSIFKVAIGTAVGAAVAAGIATAADLSLAPTALIVALGAGLAAWGSSKLAQPAALTNADRR